MARVNLIQGSEEWHAWRAGGIGGSEAAACVEMTPWSSPFKLWEQKTGRKPGPDINAAMQRGIDLEPSARAAYIDFVGIEMEPACYQSDDYPFVRASLDGINSDETILLEIKCPGETTHRRILADDVPEYYWVQCQHNMLASGAENAHFFSYRPELEHEGCDKALTIIMRDNAFINRLLEAEAALWQSVLDDTPPALLASDYAHIGDPEALDKAELYKTRYRAFKEAEALLAEAKDELLDCTDDGNCLIGTLRITRVVRQGSVNWKKLAKEHGIADNIQELYRGAETSYWKITDQCDQ